MAKADADRTSSIGDDDESMGPSCPICLISSESVRDDDDDDAAGGTHDDDDDNDDDYVTTAFVRTPCEHVFCMSCMERVLLRKPTNRRGGGGWRVVPTLGPCPMCRELVSLFDLRLEATATVDGGPSSSLYGGELEVSSWPGETFPPHDFFFDRRFRRTNLITFFFGVPRPIHPLPHPSSSHPTAQKNSRRFTIQAASVATH
jgi:hypothetical protein